MPDSRNEINAACNRWSNAFAGGNGFVRSSCRNQYYEVQLAPHYNGEMCSVFGDFRATLFEQVEFLRNIR